VDVIGPQNQVQVGAVESVGPVLAGHLALYGLDGWMDHLHRVADRRLARCLALARVLVPLADLDVPGAEHRGRVADQDTGVPGGLLQGLGLLHHPALYRVGYGAHHVGVKVGD